MYVFYSLLLALTMLFSLPYWVAQMLRSGKYRAGISERLGFVPRRLAKSNGRTVLWVHAVSVGEVLALKPLLEMLRQGGYNVFLSTTTLSGQTLARRQFGDEKVFYFPFDFTFAVRRYLRKLNPRVVVVAETEFWPNFLRLSKAQGAAIAIVNARISDRSLPGYQRFRRLLQPVLRQVDLFLAQSALHRRRLIDIGADPQRIKIAGNLKFDAKTLPPASVAQQLQAALDDSFPVVVCGSTMQGEENFVLNAFRTVVAEFPKAVMVLAPRHPERFPEVWRLLLQCGLKCWRRSELMADTRLCGGILLLDTVGELANVYSLASLAFVGGSLVPGGGHNILEPARYAVPITIGPSSENFREIMQAFTAAGAVKIVTTQTIAQEWLGLLKSPEMSKALGQRGRQIVQDHAGATEKTLTELKSLLAQDRAVTERTQ